MTERERMLAGMPYNAGNRELVRLRTEAHALAARFNATSEEEPEQRLALLRQLLGSTGKNLWIEPSFRCDYGFNIHVGDNFYANFDCIILDVCRVTIGKNVFLGPRVCIYTAGHPVDAVARDALLEFGSPVTLGDSVWIGGNTVINPGVTVGSGTVVGSGSVVTKDLPPGVIAAGNPCRVLRKLTEADRSHWAQELRRYRQDQNL